MAGQYSFLQLQNVSSLCVQRKIAVFDIQIWRALRLIVDTGIHYRGMKRYCVYEAMKSLPNGVSKQSLLVFNLNNLQKGCFGIVFQICLGGRRSGCEGGHSIPGFTRTGYGISVGSAEDHQNARVL